MNITENLVAISGNTYPVKEQLKSQCGAKWDGDRKVWLVTADKADAAQALVASAGPKKAWSGGNGGFRAVQSRHYQAHGDIGYCGARGCGRYGCADCNPD